jgi:hypothetical protein
VQEKNSASEETMSESPRGRGDDEVDQKEDEEEEDEKKQGKLTPPKDPLTKAETSKKRKVSPKKPSARRKSHMDEPHYRLY